jgi:hypothetical protein
VTDDRLPGTRSAATGHDALMLGIRWSREIERSQRERDREIADRYRVEMVHRARKRLDPGPGQER